jgi:hypothetical protein
MYRLVCRRQRGHKAQIAFVGLLRARSKISQMNSPGSTRRRVTKVHRAWVEASSVMRDGSKENALLKN